MYAHGLPPYKGFLFIKDFPLGTCCAVVLGVVRSSSPRGVLSFSQQTITLSNAGT